MNSTTRGRRLAALAAVAALGIAAVPAGAAAPQVAPSHQRAATAGIIAGLPTTSSYCGIVWGSLGRSNGTSHTTGTVDDVRSGRHACYDRLVVDVDEVPGTLTYDVRYVDTVREDGSGRAVRLEGGAKLRVILRAPAYTAGGQATYRPADKANLVDVDDYRTLRQVAWAGSFEGQSTVGVGVRARLPFRVLVLDGPGDGARLVIDVAHGW